VKTVSLDYSQIGMKRARTPFSVEGKKKVVPVFLAQ